MKCKNLLFILVLTIFYPCSVLSADPEAGLLETSCEDDFGACTGELAFSPEGSVGSVTCLCNADDEGNSKDSHADLESGPDNLPDQEQLDQICLSTLKNCSTEKKRTKKSSEENNESNTSNCSIGKLAITERSIFELIRIFF